MNFEDNFDIRASKPMAPEVASQLPQTLEEVVASKGNIVRVDQMDGTDYILIVTDNGAQIPVHRRDAIMRAKAVLDMLLAESNSADPVQMDKDISLVRMVFLAAVKNGKAQGKNYSKKSIKEFDHMLLKIEKEWRQKSDAMTAKQKLNF